MKIVKHGDLNEHNHQLYQRSTHNNTVSMIKDYSCNYYDYDKILRINFKKDQDDNQDELFLSNNAWQNLEGKEAVMFIELINDLHDSKYKSLSCYLQKKI